VSVSRDELSVSPTLARSEQENGKENVITEIQDGERRGYDGVEERDDDEEMVRLEKKLVRKVDF
jgi:hypothetical protein